MDESELMTNLVVVRIVSEIALEYFQGLVPLSQSGMILSQSEQCSWVLGILL
jgi:Tfp pilus assembly major pilin PilA